MKYTAILRGINVSGKNIIKMADLKSVLGANGFGDVKTYIQSGNLAFEHKVDSTDRIASKIGDLITKHFSLTVPVIVLDTNQLNEIVANNPFLVRSELNTKQLHVTFLAHTPDEAYSSGFKALSFLPDEFFLTNTSVYLNISVGYGNTKLSNQFIERKLKVTATTRNWNTVRKLQQMIHE